MVRLSLSTVEDGEEVGLLVSRVNVLGILVHGPGPWKEPFSTKTRDKFKHLFLTTLIPPGYFGV